MWVCASICYTHLVRESETVTTTTTTFTAEAAAVVVQMLAQAEAKMTRVAQVFGVTDEDFAAQFAAVKSAQAAMGVAA